MANQRRAVARAFLDGRHAVSGHMISAAGRVTSYNQTIARLDAGAVIVTPHCPRCDSRTTRGHLAAMLAELAAAGYRIDRDDGVAARFTR